ncbi:MAG: hypothetical protein HDR21_09415 [Lachnospiraceae bacterium]|nr:hypothetical protein [Lachnospiraceae bacterium]MBD5483228.1 hypothetical protein [Lachnospiraceae bacterium]
MEYVENDLVRIAKRENNTKRKYLVVNPLQGKHIPVSPTAALKLFSNLADLIRYEYVKEKTLLIGFAETATAIGAQAAVSLGTKYIQTTREIITDVEYLFFSEEHSHATEQKLVKDDIDLAVENIENIVFIEDEVTTGKTILNIIQILEKLYPGRLKFSVASLLNGMSEENLQMYEQRGIRLHYLLKTDHSQYSHIAGTYMGNGKYCGCNTKKGQDISVISVPGRMDTRRLVDAVQYEKACNDLWDAVAGMIGNLSRKKLLVVGTEEFMYPALFIGRKLEETGNAVLCHATTRSPIAVSMENEYPLHSRYELISLYDGQRRTFLYDIDGYDSVFIITDSPERETIGLYTLVNALSAHNKNITLIRWC